MDEFARGWRVLLAATIGMGLGTTGLTFYSFGAALWAASGGGMHSAAWPVRKLSLA